MPKDSEENLPGTIQRSPAKAQRAKKLDVSGRSKMSKKELSQAIARKQD